MTGLWIGGPKSLRDRLNEQLQEQEMTDDIYYDLGIDPNEPEGDDYMPDELYTEDGEIIDAMPKSINEQLLDNLGKRFDRGAVKQRAGYGGKMLDYLATDTVIRRLNQTAQAWSFEIQSLEFRDNLCIVVGRLTIPGLGTRSGIGVQQLMQGGGSEDLVKGASSDALKKAATLFGVGLELYGPDLEALAAQSPQQAPQAFDFNRLSNSPRGPVTTLTAPQNAPVLPPKPDNYNGATQKQLDWIASLERDIDQGELAYLYQVNDIDRMNLTGGRGGTASRVIDLLKARKEAPTEPTF